MRLGQFSRSHGISISQIVKESARLGVELGAHPNVKIPEELLEQLLVSFGTEDYPTTDSTVIVENKLLAQTTPDEATILPKKDDLPPPETTTKPEPIRPVIPVLTGPKVLGKIELPERPVRNTSPRAKVNALKEHEMRPAQKFTSRRTKKEVTGNEVRFGDEMREQQIRKEAEERAKRKAEKKEKARLQHLTSIKAKQKTIPKDTHPKKKQVSQQKSASKTSTIKKPSGILSRLGHWLLRAD
jgi:hypothetical protein